MSTRDYQRARVYAWEREVGLVVDDADRLMTLRECEDLADAMLGRTCYVRDGRGRRRGATVGVRAISLPRWTRQPAYVAHEVAHLTTTDSHGPRFMRRYIDLLVEHLGLSRTQLEASAVDCGVEVAP